MAKARVTALSSERLKPQAQIPGVLYWSLGLRGIPLEMHGAGASAQAGEGGRRGLRAALSDGLIGFGSMVCRKTSMHPKSMSQIAAPGSRDPRSRLPAIWRAPQKREVTAASLLLP